MPRGPISMRKIREILRLKWELKCSHHLVAQSVGVSSSTVGECLRRATHANLAWPLPPDVDDGALITLLYGAPNAKHPVAPLPIDWNRIHQELKRKHVTKLLLWEEYRADHSDGVSYSQFCKHYQAWSGKLNVWMRQTHKYGEKCFVDYTGMTMPIIDRTTGEAHEAEIFVGCLGGSDFTFCEATLSQGLEDWIGSHVRMFAFFGGVPDIIVPDNLKSGVHKAHRYEPDLNPTYQDMASHYGVAIIPARVATPKDKAKAENAVQQVERRVLAKLRDRQFFSLIELNSALSHENQALNHRPFQQLPGSRQSQFLEHEKKEIHPLPESLYVFARWKIVRAGQDYHVTVDDHHYSVPYTYAKQELDARTTQNIIEIFCKGKRIASHRRSFAKHKHSTITEHMPKSHRQYAEWTPERIINWAKKTGDATAKLLEVIMQSRAHPQQGFRSCLGILRFEKSVGKERLESACLRAITIGAHSYKSIESILKNNLDRSPTLNPETHNAPSAIPAEHEYVRGQDYFN